MIITKHISLDKGCIEKLKPYVEKHSSNFSAAVRELIETSGKSLPANACALDSTLLNWMLSEIEGVLLPDNVLDEIIDRRLINSMEELENYLNKRFNELEWDVSIDLKYDNAALPSEILAEIRGAPQEIKFVASLLSQYLVKNSPEHVPLEIRSVANLNDCIKVELSRTNKKKPNLVPFFGASDEAMHAIKSNPAFWKAVINRHVLSNYNMITVHRNYFEDLLSGNVPLGEITIENLAKKPIQDIPLKELLSLIKEVYETSRVAERVEIKKDNIILFHNYRNKEAIEKLKKILVALLEASGHLYDAKSTSNMIVLTHRPEIGIKINEIVNNLKTSTSRVDRELIMFMAFLKGFQNMPDIPLSLASLGRRIGVSLMQEYENENRIKSWNLEAFQRAFKAIDSKLCRESVWKLEDRTLSYTIKKCSIAMEGDTLNTCVCHTAREAFKGALNYAFGNKAELEVKKLLTHGDDLCEVLIKLS